MHNDELTAPGMEAVPRENWLSFVLGVDTNGEELFISSNENIREDPNQPMEPVALTEDDEKWIHGERICDRNWILFPSRFSHYSKRFERSRTILAGQLYIAGP
jgi:hypothetical protein